MIKNTYLYYLILTFNNFWFITSNWLFFWIKYMSISEVGIIDSIAFLVGILFEFPSGIISDRFGRKKTLILSQVIQFLGSFTVLISNSKYEIAFGFIIFQIGVALYSGTIESFGYESSSEDGFNYGSVLFTSSLLSNFGYLLSVLIGGYIYLINQNLPNFMMGLNYLLGLIFSILILEKTNIKPEAEKNINFNLEKFELDFVLFLILVFSLCFAFDYGFLKLKILELFSNEKDNFYYIFVATSLSLVFSKVVLGKVLDYKKYLKFIILILALLLISFFITNIGIVVLFFALSFLAVNLYQLSLKYFNERLDDSERASGISLFNMAYKLPYVLLSLAFGFSFNKFSMSNILGFFGIFLIIGYLLIKKISRLGYNRGYLRGA